MHEFRLMPCGLYGISECSVPIQNEQFKQNTTIMRISRLHASPMQLSNKSVGTFKLETRAIFSNGSRKITTKNQNRSPLTAAYPKWLFNVSVLNIDFRLFISLLHVDTQIPNICSNKEWQIIIVIFVLIECDTFDLSVKPSENIFERE